MERRAVAVRLEDEIRHTIKYPATRMGLKPSEIMRTAICKKVEGLRDTLTQPEQELIVSNLKVENAQQTYRGAQQMNEIAEAWKRSRIIKLLEHRIEDHTCFGVYGNIS